MGKGDIKTKKGKIHNGSYGITRRKKDNKPTPKVAPKAEAKVEAAPAPVKAAPKTTTAKAKAKAPAAKKPKKAED